MPKFKTSFNPHRLKKLAKEKGFQHPKYGDLLHPNSITMPKPAFKNWAYPDYSPYFIHISVTNRCNACCRGCVNSEITDKNFRRYLKETNPERDAAAINNLIAELKEDVVICLYGGEPLLRPEKIRQLIQIIDKNCQNRNTRYMLYTNGLLLGDMILNFKDIIERLWLISVSVDGSIEQHKKFRPGTDLKLIRNNIKKTKERIGTNILIWSTLREEQSLLDCYAEFKRLYQKGHADYFFWHWIETKNQFRDFEAYMRKYEKELRIIMQEYVNFLKQENKVLPITHINELLLYLFTGKKRGSTSCGVELKRNYDILGSKLYACADLPKDFIIGDINNSGKVKIKKTKLSFLAAYKKDLGCYECGVVSYCGGRCPVQAFTSEEERLLQYCQLMRLHVAVVKEYAPCIKQLLVKAHHSFQDLYARSVFVNQFTDVTP